MKRICFDECWLEGHGHRCSTNLQRHHFLGRANHDLVVPVCSVANAELKLADTKWAQRVIAERLVEELGRENVEEILADVRWPELRLEALLAGPPPPHSR